MDYCLVVHFFKGLINPTEALPLNTEISTLCRLTEISTLKTLHGLLTGWLNTEPKHHNGGKAKILQGGVAFLLTVMISHL
jgi:hypothetical protein